MKIKFINVGREDKNWISEEVKEVTYEILIKEIFQHSALVSSNIEFSDEGRIYAGFHHVGDFEVLN